MTLIVTVASRNVVFQVSDRRLTAGRRPDGSMDVRDDASNKAIFYENRFLIAYTGWAELQGMSTTLWLSDRLADEPQPQSFETIRRCLTEIFRQPRFKRTHQTVAITGYVDLGVGLEHVVGLITNSLDKDGNWTNPQEEFEFVHVRPPSNQTVVMPAPGWMGEKAYNSLKRNLENVTRRGLNVANSIRLCVEAVRDVAKVHEEVGKSLMLSVLPIGAAGPRPFSFLFNGDPMDSNPTFSYMPADRTDPVQYAPVVVSGGRITSDIQMWPDEERVRIQVRR
jgi:hypothetical protein